MRRLLSGLLGLLSVLALPVALVALWGSSTLTRTDVFVQEARPLISTRPVQEALTEAVVRGVLDQLALPPTVEKAIEAPLRQGAALVIASPQMESVWATSMGSLHEEFVAIMEGQAPTHVDAQGRVVIEVPIALPDVTRTLAALGVEVSPSLAPVAVIPVATVDQLHWVRLGYSVLDSVGPWGPVAVIGLALLAVALAVRRRGVARLVVAGWAVSSAALGLALMLARQPVVDQVTDPTVRALADAAYGMAQRGVFSEIGAVLVGCVVLLLVLAIPGRRRGH